MRVWDAIVVGSGLLGASVARRLAESGCSVLIVERGRAVSEPPGSHVRNAAPFRDDPDGYFPGIDHYFDYFNVDARDAALPGAYTTSIVGGVGVLWTNNCPRAVEGVDRPDLLTGAEWKIFYGLAENYLGVSVDEFDDSVRQRLVTERLGPYLSEQGRELVRLPLSGRRVGPDRIHYLGPADIFAAATGEVEVIFGTVNGVVADGRRVNAVRVDGVEHAAENVVLAAGAVDTPRLLWQSGLRPRALGRHLSFHPILIGQVILDDGLWDTGENLDPLVRLGIPPTPERPWFLMVLRDTNPLPPVAPDLDVPGNRVIEIQAFAPVDPHPDNRMSFTDSDAITFDLPVRPADEERRRSIERDAGDVCARIGRYRAGCEPQWAPLGTAHLIGSCRMGAADDGTSVADAYGRVWGTQNLYLATNGLIPTRLAVSPTLTGVALAIRTADDIVESVQ